MVEAVTVVEESTKTASSEMSNAANSSHNSRIENQNLLSLSSPSSALSSSALPSSALPTSQSLSASIHHPPRRFKARPIESSAGNGVGGTAPRLVDGIYERLIRAGEPVTDPQELQFVGLLRHHVQTSTDRSTESSQNNNNFPQQQPLQNSVENIPRRESILENVPPNGQLKQKQTDTTHAQQQRQSNNSSNMDPDSTTSTDGPSVGASAQQSSVVPPPPTITFATVPPAPLPPPPLCPITIGRGKRIPSVVPPPPTPQLPIQSQQQSQSEQGVGQHRQEPLGSPPPIEYNLQANDEQHQGGEDAVEDDDGSDIEFICEIPSGSPRPPPPPEPEPDSDSDVEFLEEVPGVVVAHVYDNIQEQQAQQLPPPEDDNLAEERLLASPPQLFPPSTTPPPPQEEDYGEFDNNDELITINSNSSSPVYPQLDSSSAQHFDENGIPFYYDEQNVAHYYNDDDDAYYNNQQWNGGGEDLQQDQQDQNSRETFQEDLVNDVNRNVGGNSVGVEHSSEGLISFDPSIGRPPALFPQDPNYQATISTEQSSSSTSDDVPMSPLTPMEPVGSNELASSISTEPPPPHSNKKVMTMCERVKEAIAVSYAAAQTQQLPPTPPVVEALQGQAAAISTQQVVVKQEDKSSTSTTIITSLPKKVASIAATASGKAPKVAQASTISTQQPVDYSVSSGVNAVGTFGSVGDCSKVSQVKDDETALTKSLVTPSVASAFSAPKNVAKVDPKPSISTDYLKGSISKKLSETSGKLPKTITKSSPIDNNNVKKTKEMKKQLSNNSATKLEKEKVGVKQKVKTISTQKAKVSTKDSKKDLLKKKLTTTIEESVVKDDDDNSLDVYDFEEDLSVDEQNFVEDEEDTEEDLDVDFMDQGSSSLNSSLTSESSLADSDSENRCDSGESDDNVDADEDAQWRQRYEANQANKSRLPEVECPGCKSMNILRSTPEGGKSIYCTTDCVERHVRAGILAIRKWKHKYEADHAPQLLRMRYKLIERTVGGTKPECWYAKTPKEILTLINRNPCLVLLLPKSVGYFDTSAAQDSGDENVEDEEEDLNEYQQDGPITKDKTGRSIMKLKKPMKNNNNKRKLKSGSKIVKQKRARSLSATEKFDLFCAAPAQKKMSSNNKSSSSRDQSVKQSGKLTDSRPITKKSKVARVMSDSSDSDDSLALPELFTESKNLDKQSSGRSNIVRSSSSSSSSDSDDDNEARRNLPSTSKAKNLFKSTVSNGSVVTATAAHAQPRKRNSLSNSFELNNEQQQAPPRVPPPPRQAVVLAGPERPRVAVAGFTSERRDGMIKRFSDLFRNRYNKDLTAEEKTRVTLEELRKLANDIENSLFEVHQKDVRKYVTHGNRIFLNANSDTNSEFFRSIFFGRFTPDRLAVMESAEMASSEKQRKAEEEKQRSLAVITQDGIDRGKAYSMMLKKTHKGEVGVGSTEGDSQDALNSTCQEFVKVVADDDGTHRKEPSACSNPSVKRVTIEPEDPLSVLKSASAPFVASPLVVDSAVIERPSSSLSSFMDDVTGPESPPPPSSTNSGVKEFLLKDRLPKSLAPSREASNNITKNFKIPKAKVVQQQEVITSGSPVPPPSPSHIPPPSPTRGGAHAPTGSSFPPLPSSSFPPLPTSSNFSQPPPTSSFPPPPTSACIPPSVVSLRRLSGEPILSALRSPKDSPTRTSRPKKAVQWNESNLVETKELDPNEPITVPIVLPPPSTASASLSLSDTIQNGDGDGLVLSEEGAGVKALLEEIKAHKLAPDDTEKMMRKVYEYINAKEYRKLTTMLKYISKEGKLPEMKSKNNKLKKSGSTSSEKRLSSSNIPITSSVTSTSSSTTTSASEDTTPTILTESGFEIRTSATFQNNIFLPLCSTASSAPAQYSPSDISPTTTATSTVDSWIHRKRSLTPPLVDAPAPKRSSPPKFHPPPSSPTEDPVIERFNSLMSSLTAPTITTTTTSGSLVAKPFATTSINDFVSTLATSLANEVMAGSSNQPTTITNATTSVFTTTSGPFFGSPPPVVSTLASTTTSTTTTSSDTPTTTKFGHFDPLTQSASVIKSEGSSTFDSITTTTTHPNATIDSVLSASTTTSVTNLSLGTTTISGSVFPSTTTTSTTTTAPISSSTSGSAATTHYQIIKTGPIYKPTASGGGQNLPIRALSVASTTTTTSTTSTSAPISVKISNFRTNNCKNNSAKQKAQQSASTLPATESWLKFQQTQQQRQPSCYGKVSFNLKQKRSPGQVAEGTSPKEQLPKHSAFSESPPRGQDGEIVGIRSFPEVDEQKPIWRGMIKNCLLPNPKSFLVSVFPVSGRRDEAKSKDSAVFQHQLQVIRGIFPNKVWPLVKREKDEHPEDLSFVLFKPINEQNRKLYQELCDFLYAKPMFGLIDRSGLTTDSFIFPLMKDREVPVKLSVDFAGLAPPPRPHDLLLGVLICSNRYSPSDPTGTPSPSHSGSGSPGSAERLQLSTMPHSVSHTKIMNDLLDRKKREEYAKRTEYINRKYGSSTEYVKRPRPPGQNQHHYAPSSNNISPSKFPRMSSYGNQVSTSSSFMSAHAQNSIATLPPSNQVDAEIAALNQQWTGITHSTWNGPIGSSQPAPSLPTGIPRPSPAPNVSLVGGGGGGGYVGVGVQTNNTTRFPFNSNANTSFNNTGRVDSTRAGAIGGGSAGYFPPQPVPPPPSQSVPAPAPQSSSAPPFGPPYGVASNDPRVKRADEFRLQPPPIGRHPQLAAAAQSRFDPGTQVRSNPTGRADDFGRGVTGWLSSGSNTSASAAASTSNNAAKQ